MNDDDGDDEGNVALSAGVQLVNAANLGDVFESSEERGRDNDL
jgi:hypothetical protein